MGQVTLGLLKLAKDSLREYLVSEAGYLHGRKGTNGILVRRNGLPEP